MKTNYKPRERFKKKTNQIICVCNPCLTNQQQHIFVRLIFLIFPLVWKYSMNYDFPNLGGRNVSFFPDDQLIVPSRDPWVPNCPSWTRLRGTFAFSKSTSSYEFFYSNLNLCKWTRLQPKKKYDILVLRKE